VSNISPFLLEGLKKMGIKEFQFHLPSELNKIISRFSSKPAPRGAFFLIFFLPHA
jgi:hypothetical protein